MPSRGDKMKICLFVFLLAVAFVQGLSTPTPATDTSTKHTTTTSGTTLTSYSTTTTGTPMDSATTIVTTSGPPFNPDAKCSLQMGGTWKCMNEALCSGIILVGLCGGPASRKCCRVFGFATTTPATDIPISDPYTTSGTTTTSEPITTAGLTKDSVTTIPPTNVDAACFPQLVGTWRCMHESECVSQIKVLGLCGGPPYIQCCYISGFSTTTPISDSNTTSGTNTTSESTTNSGTTTASESITTTGTTTDFATTIVTTSGPPTNPDAKCLRQIFGTWECMHEALCDSGIMLVGLCGGSASRKCCYLSGFSTTPPAIDTSTSESTSNTGTTPTSDSTPNTGTTPTSDSTPNTGTTTTSDSTPNTGTTTTSESTTNTGTTTTSDSTPNTGTTTTSESITTTGTTTDFAPNVVTSPPPIDILCFWRGEGKCVDPNSAEGLKCLGWYPEQLGCKPETWKCCMSDKTADARCLCKELGNWECKEETECNSGKTLGALCGGGKTRKCCFISF